MYYSQNINNFNNNDNNDNEDNNNNNKKRQCIYFNILKFEIRSYRCKCQQYVLTVSCNLDSLPHRQTKGYENDIVIPKSKITYTLDNCYKDKYPVQISSEVHWEYRCQRCHLRIAYEMSGKDYLYLYGGSVEELQ